MFCMGFVPVVGQPFPSVPVRSHPFPAYPVRMEGRMFRGVLRPPETIRSLPFILKGTDGLGTDEMVGCFHTGITHILGAEAELPGTDDFGQIAHV